MGVDTASDVLRRIPITGIAGCCARTGSGHAAAALPRSEKNSRRLIVTPDAEEAAIVAE